METKKWYLSKLILLGIIITFQGCVPIVVDLINKASVSPADVLVALSGVGTVIIRIWFTDTAIEGVK
jgi:hypothetical protein